MNREMHKFIARLAVLGASFFGTLAAMLLTGIFLIGCQYEDDYDASLIDKVARLKSLDSPKIILAGNSNLSFGMDSKMLEDALNMPVVNLGLHGGLGNAFHENIARLNINSGDMVIICHSTYSDDNRITDLGLCWVTLEYHKDLWEILRPQDYPVMFLSFPRYWVKSLWRLIVGTFSKRESPEVSAYARSSFNEFGDVAVKPMDKRPPDEKIFWAGRQTLPEINDTCINRLNELNRYIKARGAVMLVAGYPIASGEYTPPVEGYVEFQERLRGKLDCEVISDFRDYFIPYEYFYDFTLHLGKDGTKLRTRQLIKDIKNYLDNTQH
ncbi:MAG: hypothetical protein IJG65_07245 [Synergistaceae bacterium]|nr:hypothetical protein [Synergistaceae bacterium]